MGTVVVCFYCGALWFMGVCVEGVEVGAYALDWSEVLWTCLTVLMLEKLDRLTWVIPAPVSSALLYVLSGSPAVLLLTGIASIVC